ncbi:MAG: phosphomannomutase/phosphoglucomutase [Deltaproteobacteria bacterium]|nr:phosphomannomutase/phosphoglucomutase [Deltaproteobacteria bacterium]
MNPSIFREYDVRGRVDRDLDDAGVTRLGRALGAYYRRQGKSRIVVARDCRESSPRWRDLLVAALARSGCQVLDIGLNPSPVLYFGVRHLAADGGVMVTASHNPPEFNGFKILNGHHTIFGAEIQELRRLAEAGASVAGEGTVQPAQAVGPYLEYLAGHFTISRPLRVGLDAGHGAAGPVALELLRRLGVEVWPLYCEPDGRFPAHPPDPVVEANLADLRDLVRRHGLDLGVAYDGDGDRLGVVGPGGEIIWGDQLLILFARDILARHPGAGIIGEVKCSRRFYEDVARHGGRPLMWKTGHSLIKQKMLEEGALLAGEMSGHLFFADRYFGFDDAIYATGRLLEILAREGRPLTALLEDLPAVVSTPEIRRDCPDDLKFQVVAHLKTRLAGRYPLVDLDGVRLEFPDGWGLVRASNTQPALVLRFEARTAERLEEIRRFLEGILEETMTAMGQGAAK